ncbi:MAG: hypothetical protein AAB486_03580 [Patescibacteria group bacterium]
MPITEAFIILFSAGNGLFFLVIIALSIKLLKTRRQLRRHTLTPNQELQVEESHRRADQIIHKAIKRAQQLLVKSELEGLNFLAQQKIESRKIEAEHRRNISSLLEEMSYKLTTGTEEAEKTYKKFLADLEEHLAADLSRKQTVLDGKIDTFFNETTVLLNSFVTELQKQTQVQIDKEIGNARNIIGEYRRQRLEIVDENVVSILEKTLNITLGKKLTLAEQTELVYEALEEAKKGNLFV